LPILCVPATIQLNNQLGIVAVKVENIPDCGMLTPEFKAAQSAVTQN